MLMEAREDIKYSPRALILLIGLQLVDMKQLDEFLAKVYYKAQTLFLSTYIHYSFMCRLLKMVVILLLLAAVLSWLMLLTQLRDERHLSLM